jgi:uncharacterized membrane protein
MTKALSALSKRDLASPATQLVTANKALVASTTIWFIVALIGQWAFLYYIVDFFGASTLQGNFQDWTKNPFLRNAYVAGDTVGNLSFATHALLAAFMAFGGVLQLIPTIRERAIAVHRWNGRLFVITAMIASIAGLYLIWLRGDKPTVIASALPLTFNAVLIIAFGALAWRAALAGNISMHRRWALRLYLVANAQWFFRVGVFAWIIINQGPVGMTKAADGPFDRFWVVGCYLLPLAILELYLRAKDSTNRNARLAMAGGMLVLTIVMGIGIVCFTGFIWQLL